jgi:hypothetical protein
VFIINISRLHTTAENIPKITIMDTLSMDTKLLKEITHDEVYAS